MTRSVSLRAALRPTLAAIALLVGMASHAVAEPTAATMLVHGNYCGLGNNAPLPPVDALDAACARHDACTPDDDLPSKVCNALLEREAQAISLDPEQPHHLRFMASLVTAFAATTASKPGSDVATVQRESLPPTTWTILK